MSHPIHETFGLSDLVLVMPAAPGGILLPKLRNRDDAEMLDRYLTAIEAAAGLSPGSTPVILLATEAPESLLAIG